MLCVMASTLNFTLYMYKIIFIIHDVLVVQRDAYVLLKLNNETANQTVPSMSNKKSKLLSRRQTWGWGSDSIRPSVDDSVRLFVTFAKNVALASETMKDSAVSLVQVGAQ